MATESADGGVSRAEHLAWAKRRALQYVEINEMTNAMASMISDLGKHPELSDHPGIRLGMMEAMGCFLETPTQMRRWIEGFN